LLLRVRNLTASSPPSKRRGVQDCVQERVMPDAPAAPPALRISVVCQLRYDDFRPEVGQQGGLRWREDADKMGHERFAPINATVRAALDTAPSPSRDGRHATGYRSSWAHRRAFRPLEARPLRDRTEWASYDPWATETSTQRRCRGVPSAVESICPTAFRARRSEQHPLLMWKSRFSHHPDEHPRKRTPRS